MWKTLRSAEWNQTYCLLGSLLHQKIVDDLNDLLSLIVFHFHAFDNGALEADYNGIAAVGNNRNKQVLVQVIADEEENGKDEGESHGHNCQRNADDCKCQEQNRFHESAGGNADGFQRKNGLNASAQRAFLKFDAVGIDAEISRCIDAQKSEQPGEKSGFTCNDMNVFLSFGVDGELFQNDA